ncbi:IS481 family transposase ISRae1 [Austwickia sp. TVS 96-490-7B]|nr:IS481 family transposase ISRae1 [Austwickia sp. TVS 96-490-7B]
MSHSNAPLSLEGRRRLVQRCQSRPISHVAAEMGICRACASKWVNRWRRYSDLSLQDRPSTPRRTPNATRPEVVTRIERWRREHKWSAARIAHELAAQGVWIDRRTVTRHLARLGIARRKFLDPDATTTREP